MSLCLPPLCRNFLLLALICLPASVVTAATPLVTTEHMEAELVAETSSIQPGTAITLALRLKHAEHWHTYWRNPGDSGLPTRISWQLPEGWRAGAIQWPHPQKLPLGPLMNFGYTGEVFLLVNIQPPPTLKAGETATISAHAEWLVCQDICVPEGGDFSLSLPVATNPGNATIWRGHFSASRTQQPAAIKGWKVASTVNDSGGHIDLTPPLQYRGKLNGVFFFPYQGDIIDNTAPQKLIRHGRGYSLAIALAEPRRVGIKELSGVLVAQSGWGVPGRNALLTGKEPDPSIIAGRSAASFSGDSASRAGAPAARTPVSTIPAAQELSLWLALLFAFAGGILLNLMPCVFPVLSIKIMGFIGHAHHNSRLIKVQGMIFLAGVVVSFWALSGLLLALRAGGEALGWGFQLQSPGFVVALALLFLLMSLNLLGVFEIGLGLQKTGGEIKAGNLYAQAFFSGVLATVVASPCTAPFMGSAMGFTLSQPAPTALAVFTALAFGMAAPVVLLAFFPQTRKWLPKPGAWMVTFKHFLAFPLLATVIWLVWVLGSQRGNDAVMQLLAGLLLVAMAAWCYGRWAVTRSKPGLAIAVLLLASGILLAWPATPASTQALQNNTQSELAWQPWSEARVAELRAQGRPVFVDFTAAWCITCQVNKRVALNNSRVIKRFTELGVVLLKADWTNQDPQITAALAAFGRNAVPLYVLYDAKGQPSVLPELLTPSLILSELDRMERP